MDFGADKSHRVPFSGVHFAGKFSAAVVKLNGGKQVDFAERETSWQSGMVREKMVETEVTYTLEHDGKFFLIEHVPARVCRETGEQYFAPETVEHIQAVIKGGKKPAKTIETPVYEYA